ncbi:MAG TPA: M20/M25/M40 family metallo-hydrolase [Polyangiaceae bacterium]|nr:M20/M25/M40 family metallo-hydrolase [Polyangiaceae bacterium]
MQKLAVTALGWSGATPAAGIEADVVRFDSLEGLRNAEESEVAGRIVFLDVPTARSRDGHGYGAAVPARRNGPIEAARKRAAAIVIRSIGTDKSRFPHAGAAERAPGQQAKDAIASGALSNADADLLTRILERHGRARLALNLRPKWLGEVGSANVVGEIPGGERPTEIVLFGAHLDSWDLGTGAVDDGAGCGIVLEAARAIAALPVKPARTVRVVLFAAEESSLAGAEAYAKAHAAELAMHVLAFEADSGTDRVFELRYLGAQDARPRLQALALSLAPLGVTTSDEHARGGADVRPLRMLGVPVIDLQQDVSGYFDVHHTANDTFAQIDPEGLAQASSAFATAAWLAATMDGDFGRVAESDRN